jgi:hypothetical protein
MTPCVEWVGWKDRDGYGRTSGWQGAHRRAWIKAHGEIPPGMAVCHSCDNPSCINVEHLWLGTIRENNHDRAVKGRSARPNNPSRGERNGRALLTREQVRAIRELHEAEGRKLHGRPRQGITRKEMALRFGVSIPAIDAILSGRNWKGGDAPDQSFRRSASTGQGLA